MAGFINDKARRTRGLKDASLGLVGYLTGLIGAILMPWPSETVSYHLGGESLVTETTGTYRQSRACRSCASYSVATDSRIVSLQTTASQMTVRNTSETLAEACGSRM